MSRDEISMRFAAMAIVCVAGVVAGCNSSYSGGSSGDRESTSERSGALDREGPEASESPENPLRDDPSEQLLASEHIREIDWEEARSFPSLDEELVPESLEEAYAESPVPVLLPADRDALATVEPTVGRHWYAAHLQVDGRDVTIEGDRVARGAEDLLRSEEGGGRSEGRFVVTQTEGVMTLSFTAFDAAYVVDVECEEVDTRGTCTNESFTVELANELARLGGHR